MMPLTPTLIERRCTAVSSSAEGSTPTWHVCRSRDARCWRLTAKPVSRKRHGNGSRAPYCPKGAVQPHSRVVDFLAAEDVWHHDEPVALEAVNLVLQLESHTACTARQARTPLLHPTRFAMDMSMGQSSTARNLAALNFDKQARGATPKRPIPGQQAGHSRTPIPGLCTSAAWDGRACDNGELR